MIFHKNHPHVERKNPFPVGMVLYKMFLINVYDVDFFFFE